MVFRWLGRKGGGPSPRVGNQPVVGAPDRVYRVGDVIAGEWRVLKVMEGGLGIVYMVEHREGEDALCVLKAPKHQANPLVRESFRVEAETWVRLGDHPNIVRAYGVDEFAGQLFVLAELVFADDAGRISLRDYLTSDPLQPAVIASWTADFCYGMEHAQSRGLVSHRDIKPENLLIGSFGKLRITDFGIARALLSSGANQPQPETKLGVWQTRGGSISGTPPYMAPEQWLAAKQDFRTDVYAFGVTLYEMCYGRRPFLGPNIRDQHLRDAPAIPRSIFSSIIERCLAKQPEQRYATPTALLEDLTRVCSANKVSLPPGPNVTSQEVNELDGLAQGLSAVGKVEEALTAARELAALKPEDAGNWNQLGRLLLEVGDPAGASEALERSLSLDDSRSPAWNNFGIALQRQEKWQKAVFAFDRAIDCDPLNTAPMLNSTQPLRHLGQHGNAIARLKRAAKIAPDKYQIWTNLGAIYFDLEDKANCLDCYRKSLTLAPQELHDAISNSIQNALTLPDELSVLTLLQTDRAAAQRRLQEETIRNPRDKNAWHNLGLVHVDAGLFRDARECFARVLELDNADSYAICQLIELSAELKDIEAVEHWCSVMAQMRNGRIAAIAFRARALVRCDRYGDAKDLIMAASRQYPDEPDIWVACGDVWMTYPDSSTAMSNASVAYYNALGLLKRGNNVPRLREIEGRFRRAQENLERCKREDGIE